MRGKGRFEDIVQYGEFLGSPPRKKKDFLGVGKEMFQSEVHRIFPAEREVLEREKCLMFDCHLLVFETESRLFNLFCKFLAMNFYFPIIVDLHEVIRKSESIN